MSKLNDLEIVDFRNHLRAARYSALADAESFQQMCFAIEALGKRLNPKAVGLAECQASLKKLVQDAGLLSSDGAVEGTSKRFDALFLALKEARNDIAHTGAYARHVTTDAVAICLVLEDALMNRRLTVKDFMVSSPVIVQPWQTVGYARQLMLLNSFSFLPMWEDGRWWLLSDIALVKYFRQLDSINKGRQKTIEFARAGGLRMVEVSPVDVSAQVSNLLELEHSGLWLITQEGYPPDHLVGVLSPFELM